MRLRNLAFGIVFVLGAALGSVLAQNPGQNRLSTLVGPIGIPAETSGPQSAYIPLNGGTGTCNGTATITVANTNVDAGSIIIFTLKTVGGTVGAQPALKTITAGTGFQFACTASDTSTYNFIILG